MTNEGAAARVILTTSCANGKKYDESNDTCI